MLTQGLTSVTWSLRIGAKHQELRQKQVRSLAEYSTGPVGPPPDIDDDETDPNYARVNHFRERYPALPAYRPSSPPLPENFGCSNPPAPGDKDHLEGLYARINKPPHQHAPVESHLKKSDSDHKVMFLYSNGLE
ncbi:UNVERIFIED_CONTAM: hypothetical protein K2H54_047609 [Gekko kuhli]